MIDTTIDKEKGLVSFTKAGIVLNRTITYNDCIISVVPTIAGTEFKRVNNIYINVTTGKLIVVYEP